MFGARFDLAWESVKEGIFNNENSPQRQGTNMMPSPPKEAVPGMGRDGLHQEL